jgi:hypothetical protein
VGPTETALDLRRRAVGRRRRRSRASRSSAGVVGVVGIVPSPRLLDGIRPGREGGGDLLEAATTFGTCSDEDVALGGGTVSPAAS